MSRGPKTQRSGPCARASLPCGHTLGRRQPAAYVVTQVSHGVGELSGRLALLEQLGGNLKRGENRSLVGLDDAAAAHHRADRTIDVLRDGERVFRRGLRPDGVLL